MYHYNYRVKINGIETELKVVYSDRNSFQYNTLDDSTAYTFSKPLKAFGYNKPFINSGNKFELLPNVGEKKVTLTESEFASLIQKHAFFISSNNFMNSSKHSQFLKKCEDLFV